MSAGAKPVIPTFQGGILMSTKRLTTQLLVPGIEEGTEVFDCRKGQDAARFVRAVDKKAGRRVSVRFRNTSTTGHLTILKDMAGRSCIKLDDLSDGYVSRVLTKDDWKEHPNRSFSFTILEDFFTLGNRLNFMRLSHHLEEIRLWKE